MIDAPAFPALEVRARAREGTARAFPPRERYGHSVIGSGTRACLSGTASGTQGGAREELDDLRLVPPVFMPRRLEKLVELGREPMHTDVNTSTFVGGFLSPLPLFVSALGSTAVSGADLGECVAHQAGRLGLPVVLGENIVPVSGYGRSGEAHRSLLSRLHRYCAALPEGLGGVAVQQSTQDADAEVWNLVYSDPSAAVLLDSGRLAFELKVGQGAKPGLGGMTVIGAEAAAALADRFSLDSIFGDVEGTRGEMLRCASPGTFTRDILRQQIRLMRNNFPRAKVWVKLHPGRDVCEAAEVCWEAGADAVTVDGAEAGTGWAPLAFLDHVGLPLLDCLRELGRRSGSECLLASCRMWEGARIVKTLALGARAAGLGRAAFLAVDENREAGLIRLVECIDLEIRLLVSALGKYDCAELGPEDLWPAPVLSVSAHAPFDCAKGRQPGEMPRDVKGHEKENERLEKEDDSALERLRTGIEQPEQSS
jgi:hypothetical protein